MPLVINKSEIFMCLYFKPNNLYEDVSSYHGGPPRNYTTITPALQTVVGSQYTPFDAALNGPSVLLGDAGYEPANIGPNDDYFIWYYFRRTSNSNGQVNPQALAANRDQGQAQWRLYTTACYSPANNGVGFILTQDNSSGTIYQNEVTNPINTLNHALFQRRNGVISYYLNGKQVYKSVKSGHVRETDTARWDNRLIIGSSNYSSNGAFGHKWAGQLDEIAMGKYAIIDDNELEFDLDPSKRLFDYSSPVPGDGGDQPPTDPVIDMKLHVLLKIDQTVDLTGYMHPVGANPPVLVWSSENAAIASVDQNGKVTGNAVGKTIIFVQTQDGSWSAFARIKVIGEGEDELLLSVLLEIGETCILFPEFDPADAQTAVLWSSSDTTIATVNPVGLVTGIAPGLVTITAKTADNKLTDAMYVTVVADKVQG